MAKLFTKEGDDYKEVEAFTQDEVNDIVGKRVDRTKEQFADYDDLKTKASSVDTVKTEYEEKLKKAGEEKTDLEKQLAGAKLGTEKVKIMHEFKLSDDMEEFVTGDTVDDLRKKAEKLSKGAPGGKLPIKKEEKPKGGTGGSDSKSIAGKLFGKKSDD